MSDIIWNETNQFRWKIYWGRVKYKVGGPIEKTKDRIEPILEQLWTSDKGANKWKAIETIYEE